MSAPASQTGARGGLSVTVVVGRNVMSNCESFTRAQALVLQLVFNVADWACRGGRTTQVNNTGRHRISSAVAGALVERGLLKDAWRFPYESASYTETIYRITRRGETAVRALDRAGWTQTWLEENQARTKAQRFEKKWAALTARGGA